MARAGREACFGMFVHWGAMQMAGVWEGKRIDTGIVHGIGEWIMLLPSQ